MRGSQAEESGGWDEDEARGDGGPQQAHGTVDGRQPDGQQRRIAVNCRFSSSTFLSSSIVGINTLFLLRVSRVKVT